MVIVMDMETGRVEATQRQASDTLDEVACAGWVDVPPPLQHQATPRLAERVAEPGPAVAPDLEVVQRVYRAQRG